LPQHLNLLRARPPVRHPHTRQRQLLARKQDNMRLILRVPVAVERLSDHHIANPVDFNGVLTPPSQPLFANHHAPPCYIDAGRHQWRTPKHPGTDSRTDKPQGEGEHPTPERVFAVVREEPKRSQHEEKPDGEEQTGCDPDAPRTVANCCNWSSDTHSVS